VNINSFKTAFRKTLPIGESFKIDIFIKRRKCTQTVIVKDELSKNTLGVDFIQNHRLHYDHDTQQLRFLQTPSKAISAIKNFTIQPLATTIVQVRSFQKMFKNQNYVADIWALKTPLITRPSSLVTFDENNYCTIWLQNCTPYEVTVKTGDILGIVDTKNMTPIPLDDHSIASICNQIYERLPKVKKRTWTRKEIEERCHLGAPEKNRAQYVDTLFRHQAAISMNKYDLGLAKDFSHRIHLKDHEPIYCNRL
jgi:hypothetical protein